MDVANLLLAIEALGFDEESIDIRKHLEHHNNIMRDTFFRKTWQFVEGVGSKYEGLGFGRYGRRQSGSKTDTDMVYNFPGISLLDNVDATVSNMCVKHIAEEERVNPEDGLTIVTCSNFPGYVYLLYPQKKVIPNIDFNIKHLNRTTQSEIKTLRTTQNGPACTLYIDFGGFPMISKYDIVDCLLFKSWPIEASKWAERNRPNKWPSKELIETIMSKGFNLAPVGHYDSNEKEFQWRIGILGEKELCLNLNQTQKLCYIALKLILKGDILQIHEDILSSYHMKNLIFWCAEQEPCKWTKENFEICLKTCISRLIKFITLKQFPHYFIKERNLINSKMTFKLKEQIVKALTKYSDNILAILSLRIFDRVRERTNFKVELLDCLKQKSVIEACIAFYLEPFSYFYGETNSLWQTYEGHDIEVNLKNAQGILSILNEKKMHFIRHHIAYAKSMLGLLCYSRYNKNRCQKDYLEALMLIKSSLTFQNISLRFRFATLLFMETDFTYCMDECNTFLLNPKKYKSMDEKVRSAQMVLNTMMLMIEITPNNIIELTRLKDKVIAVFYDKCTSEECDAAETVLSETSTLLKQIKDFKNAPDRSDLLTLFLRVFENLHLIFFDMSFNVPYLAAEKWAVPDVIQYELLSVSDCHPESSVYGIYIDPMLNCLVLTFLCCQKTKNLIQRDEILAKMDNYVKEYRSSKEYCKLTKSEQSVPAELPHSLPLYRVYNIVAYCCFKAGRYKRGLNYIINSYKLYGNRKNTAFGYMKCVCGILNRLHIY